jgi:hypothetical protein
MPESRKRTISILPFSAGALLLAAGYLTYRANMPKESSASGTPAPVASNPSPAPIIRTKSSHEREPAGRRGGNAPSLSASEEVASLVGNTALNDSEVIAGLRLIAEDSKRPLPERTEALEHIIHLVPSENPEPLLSIAADGRQPKEISELILAEALNRPARLQGELLIRLLGHASGSMQEEVLEELKGLTGGDHGTTPADWRTAISGLADP